MLSPPELLQYLGDFLHVCWTTNFLPAPKWSVAEIPDLSGKVVLVTGGNGGIGLETAKQLTMHGAKVYIGCRTRAKADAAVAEIVAAGFDGRKENLNFLKLDLSSFAGVEKAAKEFISKESQLHILVNNGGILSAPPANPVTVDGYDPVFFTNCLSHWYLTQLLLPALLASSAPNSKSRVITVSSAAAFQYPWILYDSLKGINWRRFLPMRNYSQSKMGNLLIARELARRYGDQIVSISLHPGTIGTGFARELPELAQWIFKEFVGYPVSIGALTQLYAATSAEAEGMNGKYLNPWARLGRLPTNAEKPEIAEELWRWCEEQVSERR